MKAPQLLLVIFIVLSAFQLKADERPQVVSEKTGILKGTVRFSGKPPGLPPLVKQGAKIKDREVFSKNAIPDESLVVNKKNRGIANVFVYLRKPPEGYEQTEDLKLPEVTLEMKDCRYSPHALILRTNQSLKLMSQDRISHVSSWKRSSFPRRSLLFSPSDKSTKTRQLSKPEIIPIRITCDIHPWMQAYLLVIDHPFAAVTDRDGKFEIKGLPPGKHEFWFWQEESGWLEKKRAVQIDAGQSTELYLKFDKTVFEHE